MGLFRALAVFLSLCWASLCKSEDRESGSREWCPCLEGHDNFTKKNLVHNGTPHDDFGIGCHNHTTDASFAMHIHNHSSGAQLGCVTHRESWCKSKWCYVDPSTCRLDWEWGVVGPYSYATCGNVKAGSADYLVKSMAAFLADDHLRVFDLTNTGRGYIGGRMAAFWSNSLKMLEKASVRIKHTPIPKSSGIDSNFSEITEAFEKHKNLYPAVWSDRTSSNFDLCAFATAMGYVDLCTGKFVLTHERQEMTFVIELAAAPVFIVSKSRCGAFCASNDLHSYQGWVWWTLVFRPLAWALFAGVVLSFIVAMRILHKLEMKNESQQSATEHVYTGYQRVVNELLDCILGTFEAFVFKEKVTHSRVLTETRPISRPSYMLRLGLAFFLLLFTTIYGSALVAQMISPKVTGEIESLEAAKNYPEHVDLCVHEVYKESVKLYAHDNISPIYKTDWEHVVGNLTNGTCDAALLEEEIWNAFRGRRKLCDYYQGPVHEFYMPTGAVVSRRAYRTLETFRFSSSKASAIQAILDNPPDQDRCPIVSRSESGLPVEVLAAPCVVALFFCLGSFLHHCIGGGQPNPNEETLEQKMQRGLRRALHDRLGGGQPNPNKETLEQKMERGLRRALHDRLGPPQWKDL